MMRADQHSAACRKVLVLGLGNPDRGDDGVGALVARKLSSRLPSDVVIKIRSGDMMSLIEDWDRFDAVVCIDAAEPSGVDGRICRLDLNSTELPMNLRPGSSHAWGLPEAIALGRALQMAPRQIVIYAIEGNSFDGGAALTPAVAAAAHAVADRVVEEVDRLRSA